MSKNKKPRITECRYCSQMFTIHSLELHEKRCLENGNKFEAGLSSNTPVNAKSKSSSSTDSENSSHNTRGSRPKTVTLSAGPSHQTQRAPKVHVCYICGLRFGQSSLEIHERKCYRHWEDVVNGLPRSIRVVGAPQIYNVPSVDGTVDPSRADALAAHSANAAQNVHCSKCKRQLPIVDAHEHADTCGKKPRREIETHFVGMY